MIKAMPLLFCKLSPLQSAAFLISDKPGRYRDESKRMPIFVSKQYDDKGKSF
jgi:hypothetical protein